MSETNEILVAFLNGVIYEILTIIAMYFVFEITLHIEQKKLFFILFFISMFLANMTILYVQYSELSIRYISIATKLLMFGNTWFYLIALKILTELDYLHIFLIDMIAQIVIGVIVFAPYTFIAEIFHEKTHSLINFHPHVNNVVGFTLAILIISTLIILFRYFLKKYLSDFYQKRLKWKGLLWIIIILFNIGGLWTTSGAEKPIDDLIFITSIVMIVMFVGSLYVTSWWVRRYREKKTEEENKILNIENAVMKEYYATLDYQLERTRKFRHDIEKDMGLIKKIAKGQDDGKTIISGEIINCTEGIEENYLEDPVLNAVFVNKKNQCIAEGIEMRIKVDQITPKSIKMIDLIAIISNLLDNAIEACMKCNEKDRIRRIDLESTKQEEEWKIKVKNTTDNEQIDVTQKKTWKADTYAHGVGLSIVQEIVEKYDGLFDMKIEKGICEVTVVLKTL